jgi:hypothetical protein
MVLYHDINSYIIDENHVLFFDIFYRKKEVILICPPYDNPNINHNNIQILYNFGILKLKNRIIDNEWERVLVLIYEIETDDEIIDLNVIYNNNVKQYKLTSKTDIVNNTLSLTTLFKYDYYLMPIFYNYYKYQGVQTFFMYYNGTITDEIRSYMNYNDVKLIEWNFAYWHRGMGTCPKRGISPHHAQPGQINHALYKYGKVFSDYMIFNDLDEYMYIDSMKLVDLVKKMKSTDSFVFWNYWADTTDGNIPNKIPAIFLTDNGDEGTIEYRTKSIHKINSVDLVGIHAAKVYNKKENILYNKDRLKHFHFYTWSSRRNSDNIKTVKNRINIKLENY